MIGATKEDTRSLDYGSYMCMYIHIYIYMDVHM